MIQFALYDQLNVQINPTHIEHLRAIDNHLAHYVKGYRFMKNYKLGRWNGKIHLLDKTNRTIPYGLFTHVMKYCKKEFPDEEIKVDPQVKSLFSGIEVQDDELNTLKFTPYYYQEDAIRKLLKYSKGIATMATSSGKSLVISYIMKILLDRGEIEQGLVIVPTINLVNQFYNDMVDYGIDYEVGRINKDRKEFECPITISTWQSLKDRKSILGNYECVITDECHQNSAKEISNILSCCPAIYRMGCTGTMPSTSLDNLQVSSYIGPVIIEYGSQKLAEEGYISTCKVNTIKVKHPVTYTGDYWEIKDQVFKNDSRIDLIKRIIENANDSMLLLVNKVEDEGEYLKDKLEQYEEMQDKEIVFISGKMKANDREYWRQRMNERGNVILIATYQVFSVGVNIPSLKYVLFASPLKSKIKVLQSIGRSLRKHTSKEGALIYDLVDQTRYLKSHGDSRIRHYNSESFEITEEKVKL